MKARKRFSSGILSRILGLEREVDNIKQSFQDGCDTIVAGCTTYGNTPTSNSPADIVNAIKNIYNNRYNAGVAATKVGTAVEANVLSGKTFTNSSGVGKTGTMTNNGAVSKTITPSSSAQTYTIPAGYHNGSGKVTVNGKSVTVQTITSTMTNGGWQADLTSISNYANLVLYKNIFPVTTQMYAGANEYNIPFSITYSNGIVKCVRSTGSASAPNAGICYVVI